MAVIGALGVVIGAAAQIIGKQPSEQPLWIILTATGAAVGLPAAVSQSRWWQQRSTSRQEEHRRQQERDRELHTHFAVSGRGLPSPGWQGDYFTGRTRAVSRLIAWLDGEATYPIMVVTGQPGSGKSAVLGRLIILADPDLRQQELNAADPMGLPHVSGKIDCAVHARAKDTSQILLALLQSAGLGPGIDSVEELLLAIPKFRRPLTVIIDALDEAVQPERIARELLSPLLDSSPGAGVRLLIGTRPHLLRALAAPQDAIIDLDNQEYFCSEDLVEYAQRWLPAVRSASAWLALSPVAGGWPGPVQVEVFARR